MTNPSVTTNPNPANDFRYLVNQWHEIQDDFERGLSNPPDAVVDALVCRQNEIVDQIAEMPPDEPQAKVKILIRMLQLDFEVTGPAKRLWGAIEHDALVDIGLATWGEQSITEQADTAHLTEFRDLVRQWNELQDFFERGDNDLTSAASEALYDRQLDIIEQIADMPPDEPFSKVRLLIRMFEADDAVTTQTKILWESIASDLKPDLRAAA